MANEEASSEKVRVSIQFDIAPEHLADMFKNLGVVGIEGLSADTHVETDAERILDRPLTKQTFRRHWNNQGAGQAWQKIWAATVEFGDFPLHRVESEDDDVERLAGSLLETVEWLGSGALHGNGSGIAATILERIYEERLTELQAREGRIPLGDR